MADKRTYKLVGRYPNEAVSFGSTCRVEFHNFIYTTQNPVEIAAIESSSMFQAHRIMRVGDEQKQRGAAGKATTTGATIGLKTPLDSNKDSEIEALRKENAALKAENSELSTVLDAKAAEDAKTGDGSKAGEKGDGGDGKTEDPVGAPDPTTAAGDDDKKPEDDSGKKKQDGKK